MIENQYFKSLPTELDLNGPVLSFSLQPVGLGTTVTGSVTLTGIATASFIGMERSALHRKLKQLGISEDLKK